MNNEQRKNQIRILDETLDKTRAARALIDSLTIPRASVRGSMIIIIERVEYGAKSLYRDLEELRDEVIDNE
jgi:hypothetical protein